MRPTISYIVLIFGLIIGFVCLPIANIWALNTLFGLTIEYSIQTWAASLLLSILISSGGRYGK